MTRNFYYNTFRLFVQLYSDLMFRMNIRRLADLPAGPKLFVANHPSGVDPFLIHLLTRDHLSVLITESAFKVPLIGWLITRSSTWRACPALMRHSREWASAS